MKTSAVFMLDPAGNVAGWNAVAQAATGYAPEAILGRNFSLFFTPGDLAADRPGQILRRAGAEGNCDADGMYLMADGIARRSDARVTAQLDASGALLGFVVLAQEISGLRDQEEAERELRSQKLFGDIMMESMPGILYLYDTQGRFLRWNRTFETASGYTGEEIARMHPLDFFPERARQNVKSRIEEVFATGASSVEADFMAKDGSLVPYSFNGRRVRFQGRECLVGVGIDIAELVRAQAELAESESNYRKLFEYSPEGILIADAESRYLDANPAICRMLGYAREELITMGAQDIIQPEEERQIKTALTAIRGKSDYNREWRFRRKDGTLLEAEVTATLMPDGKLMGLVRDISERKRAESEKEMRERAEAADHIKSAFLATMSHELRTPLNSIVGFTGILLQGLAGPLNPEQNKQLDMVRSSARHLLALVNDVLDISKIEAGQFEVELAPFDIRESIDKAVSLVGPQAAAKKLDLRIQIAPDLRLVAGDARRFGQILINLLSNAVKFTDRGGVTLSADASDAVRVRITDTGIGIRAGDIPLLFQPFRQIESGLARTHEGTGLGLAICRRLAELMGGGIAVESEWGKGSTFTVMLPLNTDGAAAT